MKVLNKFTIKNLKLNKSRTIVTIIGIMLSCALIMVVAGMAASAQQTMVNAQINVSGDYDLVVKGANQKILDNAEANRNVKAVYIKQKLGCAYLPQAKLSSKPYINVVALNEKAYTDCFNITLKEGRLPQNENELVLSSSVLENSRAEFKVGDTITLDLGKRVYVSDAEIPINDTEYFNDGNGLEKLVDTHKKTYTIVGIFNNIASSDAAADSFSASSSAFTLAEENADINDLFISFTSDGEKDYITTSGEILNLTGDDFESLKNDFEVYFENGDFDEAGINKDLLRYKGFALSDQYMGLLFSLATIIITIIIIASIFVIRNSFAISITEKTKLYGMLASVGATSKQIRHNVLFEGYVLGIIGIPAGLLLGTGVIYLLVVILNALLGSMLNGISFAFALPWWVAAVSAVLSAVIILFSTLSSAFRASRIAPITAIRGNNDIKINKNKRKSYKAPRFIKKLFGVGGEIAYKNLKRSKKKYRTTVISIIVTVTMFISISTFIEYEMKITGDHFKNMPYNITVYANDKLSYDEYENIYKRIIADTDINSSIKACENYYGNIVGLTDYYTEDAKAAELSGGDLAYVFGVDNKSFKEYVTALGYNYDDVKDKALITNDFKYYNSDNILIKGKEFDLPMNTVVKLYPNGNPSYTEDDIKEIQKTDPDFVYNPDDYKSVDLVIYDTINKEVPGSIVSSIMSTLNEGSVLVSEDYFKKLFAEDNDYTTRVVVIDSAEPAQTVEYIKNLGIDGLDIYNLNDQKEQINAVMLIIAIFAYGFIIVISLIGITNVFNTINTNMRLRSKEFAMLKSIGMTKKEFNRMIRLESLFYGLKSLLIGVPLGLLGGYAIFKATGNTIMLDYSFPTMAVLISIVFVFFVVWLIMKLSISKVNKQNIIETIRNDNI
ncbi:MAG: FtsX-like permease family protein [Ruminococcus sp.]|uniref:ABC transporter permease n=1 Tax=Ruminococcus sp. TaxID=41978 RepID=UPI0025FBBECE|nr:ABC transporter permease [Ruminococcus sp.]MBD9049280.1 FtsX-like permease family protein [Ruminococcus sp.]